MAAKRNAPKQPMPGDESGDEDGLQVMPIEPDSVNGSLPSAEENCNGGRLGEWLWHSYPLICSVHCTVALTNIVRLEAALQEPMVWTLGIRLAALGLSTPNA